MYACDLNELRTMWTHAHKVSYEVSLICFASPTSLCRKKQSDDTLTKNRVNCRYWVIGSYYTGGGASFRFGQWMLNVFCHTFNLRWNRPFVHNFEYTKFKFNSWYCSVYVLFLKLTVLSNRVLIFSHSKKKVLCLL